MITGVSLRTLQSYISRVKRGEEGFAAVGRPSGWEGIKSELARCFLNHYASCHDKMPNATVDGIPEV